MKPRWILISIVLAGASEAFAFGPGRTVSAAFAPGRDIPAEQLHVSRHELENTWKAFMENGVVFPVRVTSRGVRTILPTDASWVDWDVILALNGEAADLWGSIVDAYQGDAEAARWAYFSAGYSAEIRQRLFDFRARLGNYLESALIRNLRGRTGLPLVHPLLVQALLEEYALGARFLLIDYPRERKYFAEEAEGMDKAYFGGEIFSARGLPPVPAEGAGREAVESERRAARRVMNAVQFLIYVPGDRCATWGLWPRASATVLARRPDNNWVLNGWLWLKGKVERACGGGPLAWPDVRDIEDLASFPVVTFSQGFVGEFRRMGRDYSPGGVP